MLEPDFSFHSGDKQHLIYVKHQPPPYDALLRSFESGLYTDRNPTNAMTRPPDKGGRPEKYASEKIAQAIKTYEESGGKRTKREVKKHLRALADEGAFGHTPDGGIDDRTIRRWRDKFCRDWPSK